MLVVGKNKELSFWTPAAGIGKNGTVQVTTKSLFNSPTEWIDKGDAKKIIEYLTSAFDLNSEEG